MQDTLSPLTRTAWLSAAFCASLLALGGTAGAASPHDQVAQNDNAPMVVAAGNPSPPASTPSHPVQDVAAALAGRLHNMVARAPAHSR